MTSEVKYSEHENTCTDCRTVKRLYDRITVALHTFVFHLGNVFTSVNRMERTHSKESLHKRICALQNTKGGSIIIHLSSHSHGDRYLEHFDEFFSGLISSIAEDGTMRADSYHRRWLCDMQGFEEFQTMLHVTVKQSEVVSTVDFSTSLRDDIENYKPSAMSILKHLSKALPSEEKPFIRGLPQNVQYLHENRHIELKAFRLGEKPYTVHEAVDFIWNNLKLKYNLTSMSKIHGGGSFYVGIEEQRTPSRLSKIPIIKGFQIADESAFKVTLLRKAKANMCVLLPSGTFSDLPSDLFAIELHPVPNTDPNLYVLEVAVKYFCGVIFYDIEGPRSYTIKNGCITRIPKCEWYDRLQLLKTMHMY